MPVRFFALGVHIQALITCRHILFRSLASDIRRPLHHILVFIQFSCFRKIHRITSSRLISFSCKKRICRLFLLIAFSYGCLKTIGRSIKYQSIAHIFIPDAPVPRNVSTGYAFSLMGPSPLRGSPGAALLGCDGFISLDLRTGQKYHYYLELSSPPIGLRPTG